MCIYVDLEYINRSRALNSLTPTAAGGIRKLIYVCTGLGWAFEIQSVDIGLKEKKKIIISPLITTFCLRRGRVSGCVFCVQLSWHARLDNSIVQFSTHYNCSVYVDIMML